MGLGPAQRRFHRSIQGAVELRDPFVPPLEAGQGEALKTKRTLLSSGPHCSTTIEFPRVWAISSYCPSIAPEAGSAGHSPQARSAVLESLDWLVVAGFWAWLAIRAGAQLLSSLGRFLRSGRSQGRKGCNSCERLVSIDP